MNDLEIPKSQLYDGHKMIKLLQKLSWKDEKTSVLLHQISKMWSTPLVYNGSNYNFLRYAIMYSKCVLLINIEVCSHVQQVCASKNI